jgi:hypothetical protein
VLVVKAGLLDGKPASITVAALQGSVVASSAAWVRMSAKEDAGWGGRSVGWEINREKGGGAS